MFRHPGGHGSEYPQKLPTYTSSGVHRYLLRLFLSEGAGPLNCQLQVELAE